MGLEAVTFRSELKSRVSDLLTDLQMTCQPTEEALVKLSTSLADLKEEGVPLFPNIIVCDDLDAVLRVVQGSSPITLGRGAREAETVALAVKKCAPLAGSGWAIWIQRGFEQFSYGVFQEPATPTAIDIASTFRDIEDETLRVLLAARVAPGVVMLMAPGDVGLEIHLSGERATEPSRQTLQHLADAMVSAIEDPKLQEATRSYLMARLDETLRQGHGTLIAVQDHGKKVPSELLKDSIVLADPIDLATLIGEHKDSPTSSALASLLAYTELFGGMIRSDGIVIVDTKARIRGFNGFIKTKVGTVAPRALIGGARHRAYAELCGLVDKGRLKLAYIRSAEGTGSTHGRTDA